MVSLEPVRTIPDTVPPPERTLGWDILAWCSTYLLQPDGPDAGKPWEFTPEQVRIVLRWYEIDGNGVFTKKQGTIRRLKGWGKDPFLAALSAAEFVGPCRFGGWRPDGTPYGVPHSASWVQICAVSKEQTKNTMLLFPGLFSDRCKNDYGIDLGKEIIYSRTGGMIQAVTSSPRTLEGGRATFVVMNEALALDTRLPTVDGWTTVRDVKVGDRLIGSNGLVSVVKVTPVYNGRTVYRVRFADGTHLDADAGHLWETRVVASAAKPRVRTTQEMVDDGRRFAVPVLEPFDAPPVDLPLDPYVLGLWLGDGDSRAAGLTVGREDAEFILNEVRRRGVPGADFTRTREDRALRISLKGNRSGGLYTKDGSSVRGALVELGVLGNKHIPSKLLRASLQQRLDLLRGLLDSDGWVTTAGVAGFANSNRRLMDDVVQLLRSLGMVPTPVATVTDHRWSQKRTGYRVSFRPDAEMNPFLLPRKAERVRPGMRKWKTITSIEPVDSVPVRCIEVDSDDRLFAAGDGWTLTHNTHHWISSNGGHDMAQVIAGNVGKSRGGGARTMEITNAPLPGENSVAEQTWHTWSKIQEGKQRDPGIYYDSVESPPVDISDPEQLRAGIIAARGDAHWLDVDWIMSTIYSGTMPASRSRRMYLNQLVTADDALISPADWDACADETLALTETDPITLGFDGGRSSDATALVAVRIADRAVFPLAVWERPDGPEADGWEIDRSAVDGVVRNILATHRVEAFFADVAQWESYVDAWSEEFGQNMLVKASTRSAVGRDMRGGLQELTAANERLVSAIEEGRIRHPGESTPLGRTLRRHVLNARRRPNQYGLSFGKESRESGRKVDAYAATLLADLARHRVIESGKRRKPERTGKVFFF